MKGGKSKADTSKKAESKLSVKRKAAEKVTQKPAPKKAKAGKDPNKPKRPPSAFFVFMEEFRKEFKEKHPNNKKVSDVGKAGGARWKSLSAAEKAPFEAKAAKLKTEYNKTMVAYNKQSDGGGGGKKKPVEEEDEDEDESDKSKSEVHDEDDDESGEEEDDEDDE